MLMLAKVMEGAHQKDLSSKVVCFLHSCTLDIWKTEILDNMIKYFKESGFINVLEYLFINNIGDGIDVNRYIGISPKIVITNYSSNSDLFENCTLRQMHFFSQFNPNYKIIYLHTKGVSYPKGHIFGPGIRDWVNFMLYCLITKHVECIELLDYVDVVGCDRRNEVLHPGTPTHYSGN